MSNPTNLQELADSLGVIANSDNPSRRRGGLSGAWNQGYRTALLDTRATVLAMIASGREVVRTVHEYPRPDPQECPTCGALYGEMDHAPEPCEPPTQETE
jgi:hypothetical protein